ncbi:hypothetical protein Emag_001662 [Eimeria magna]
MRASVQPQRHVFNRAPLVRGLVRQGAPQVLTKAKCIGLSSCNSATPAAAAAAAAEGHRGPVAADNAHAGVDLSRVRAPGWGAFTSSVSLMPPPCQSLSAGFVCSRLHTSTSSNSSSSSSNCSRSSRSSGLGLRELVEQEEARCDDSRHLRAPKASAASQGPLGAPLPLSARHGEGPPPKLTLEESAAFAAAAAVQQKLQRLQHPKAPRRRRTLPAAAATAATAAAATAASYNSEVRLLQPAAVVVAALRAATNNVRIGNLWKGLSRRLCLVSPHLSPHQLTVALHATARIKYRDARLVDTFSPLIFKQIEDFGVKDIALLLNALRKLEVPKTDLIEILVNQFCFRLREATAQDFALVSNCLSFFYIYHSR